MSPAFEGDSEKGVGFQEIQELLPSFFKLVQEVCFLFCQAVGEHEVRVRAEKRLIRKFFLKSLKELQLPEIMHLDGFVKGLRTGVSHEISNGEFHTQEMKV